jgi:hypothetical protein
MKYYFPASMFVQGEQSHCYSQENLLISHEDQIGVEKWYPAPGQELSNIQSVQKSILSTLMQVQGINPLSKQSLQLQLNKLSTPGKP